MKWGQAERTPQAGNQSKPIAPKGAIKVLAIRGAFV